MKIATLMCLFMLCCANVIPSAPSAIAQCRLGDCDDPEDGAPALTEEDARILNEEQDEMNKILWQDCLYDLQEKYGIGNAPEKEKEKCDRYITTPTPTPTRVPPPTLVPTAMPSDTAPAAEGEDQPVCLFGLLLC